MTKLTGRCALDTMERNRNAVMRYGILSLFVIVCAGCGSMYINKPDGEPFVDPTSRVVLSTDVKLRVTHSPTVSAPQLVVYATERQTVRVRYLADFVRVPQPRALVTPPFCLFAGGGCTTNGSSFVRTETDSVRSEDTLAPVELEVEPTGKSIFLNRCPADLGEDYRVIDLRDILDWFPTDAPAYLKVKCRTETVAVTVEQIIISALNRRAQDVKDDAREALIKAGEEYVTTEAVFMAMKRTVEATSDLDKYSQAMHEISEYTSTTYGPAVKAFGQALEAYLKHGSMGEVLEIARTYGFSSIIR
jgi:hypothetical protein